MRRNLAFSFIAVASCAGPSRLDEPGPVPSIGIYALDVDVAGATEQGVYPTDGRIGTLELAANRYVLHVEGESCAGDLPDTRSGDFETQCADVVLRLRWHGGGLAGSGRFETIVEAPVVQRVCRERRGGTCQSWEIERSIEMRRVALRVGLRPLEQ